MVEGENTVVFSAGKFSETYIVQTKKDLISDGNGGYEKFPTPSVDGRITATLNTGPYYNVSDSAASAEVGIWDTDSPRVSIESLSLAGIEEGESATFKVTALPLNLDSLNVVVNIAQIGYEGVDFLTNVAGEQIVTLTPKFKTESDGTQTVIEVSGMLSVQDC